jgi:hypothetical protein
LSFVFGWEYMLMLLLKQSSCSFTAHGGLNNASSKVTNLNETIIKT